MSERVVSANGTEGTGELAGGTVGAGASGGGMVGTGESAAGIAAAGEVAGGGALAGGALCPQASINASRAYSTATWAESKRLTFIASFLDIFCQ